MRNGSKEEVSRPDVRAITRVSRYDNWHAFLTAGVIVFAILVSILYGIWLCSFESDRKWMRQLRTPTSGMELAETASELEFIQPGFSEMPEARMPEMKISLVALTDATSRVSASDLAFLGDQNDGTGYFRSGNGDQRVPGPDFLPEWERWQIEYSPESKDDYFRMLDFFDVYLGAIRQSSNQIRFLENLSNSQPEDSRGTRSSEKAKRIYFRNLASKLKVWDHSKLTVAGIDLNDSIVVQFYPDETRDILLKVESNSIIKDGKNLSEVTKTRFGCRKTNDGFEYFIEQITYQSK